MHVGPFSREYESFYAARFRERDIDRQLATPSNLSSSVAPGGPQQVANHSVNIVASASEAYSTSVAQPSRGVNKRTLDESDAIAQVPPPKRLHLVLPLRPLTSRALPGSHDVHQPSRTEQELQAPAVPNNTTSDQVVVEAAATRCGNTQCNSTDHELVDCFGPVSHGGFLEGCPFHNTQSHGIDDCLQLWRGQLTKEELFNVLITRRQNLPPFKTLISPLALAASMGKLDSLTLLMPLDRRTVKTTYAPMKLWENPRRDKLFRDPRFPTNPADFMEYLYDSWNEVVQGLTRQDLSRTPVRVPNNLSVFRNPWVSELVPYNKAFNNVRVRNRGTYPFMPKADLQLQHKQYREMAKERLLEIMRGQTPAQSEERLIDQ